MVASFRGFPEETQAMKSRISLVATAAAIALGAATAAHAGVAYPTKATAAKDLGATAESFSVTVVLKHRDQAGLEQLANNLYTPGHAQFHKFLSADAFHARFDPSADSVAKATAYFAKHGMTVHLDGNLLEVSGTAKQHEAAFGVKMHAFEIAAHGKAAASRFHGAIGTPTIADAGVAANVLTIVGHDSHPAFVPNIQKASAIASRVKPAAKSASMKAANGAALNEPGFWTVNDLAQWYNAQPLWDAGIHGEGQTLAIVTLASFTPSDAFQYWSENGLTVNPNRLKVLDVDGGPGPVCDACGSSETTLDVEQSGGMAPGANIIVYQAPNTNHSFLHAFANAVNQNKADTISVSWGSFEWFDTLSRAKGTPEGNITYLKAFNDVFLQGAIQGQSIIAAQGDAGAYEANRALPVPQFNPVLSVGAPATSPWITSAGGTTLPVTMTFSTGDVVTIPTEQTWGWAYLTDVCAHLGYDPISCGIFPVGGGGGVSSYFRIPDYQKGLKGMRVTEAGQSVVDTVAGVDYVDLPAGFRGRNVPDVSMNADPETGYILDYTDETGAYGQGAFGGGTSFVAPQLNGIAALLNQATGGRVGLLNFPLYMAARDKNSYKGGVLRDVQAGDNWFYTGVKGYDNGTGVGIMDVAGFANYLMAANKTK